MISELLVAVAADFNHVTSEISGDRRTREQHLHRIASTLHFASLLLLPAHLARAPLSMPRQRTHKPKGKRTAPNDGADKFGHGEVDECEWLPPVRASRMSSS